jgi:hypothetical protein
MPGGGRTLVAWAAAITRARVGERRAGGEGKERRDGERGEAGPHRVGPFGCWGVRPCHRRVGGFVTVFCGVAAAFAVHVVIAVTIGGVFALLPQRLVLFVVAALFAAGSVLVLLAKDADEADPAAPPPAVADQRPLRVALASFGVVFLGEWGTSPRSPPPT